MNRAAFLIFAPLGIGIALAGCGKQNKIAAVVNGQVITGQEVDERMNRLSPSYRAALKNDPQRLLEDMVMETLLVQEARRRGLDRDAEVQRLIHEARRQILVSRLLEMTRQNQPAEVTDQEVAQFYQENKKNFEEPETTRASHILVDSEEVAKKALERVKNGEPFAKVAQELSTDPTKNQGGDIGTFSRGQLIPEFEEVCKSLKPGEMSGVVKTSLGYHVILLTDRKLARTRSLEEAKDPIRQRLMAQRQQRQMETFVQELRAKAQIQRKAETLFAPVAAAPAAVPGVPAPPAVAQTAENPPAASSENP